MADRKTSMGLSLRSLPQKGRDLIRRARELRMEQASSEDLSPAEPESGPRQTVVGELSLRSIVKATLALIAIAAGVAVVVLLHQILLLLLLGVFIAMIIDPGVQYLKRWRIPESIGILIHYVVFLGLVSYLLLTLVPIIAKQLADIAVLLQGQMQQLLTDRTVSLPLVSPEINLRLTVYLRMVLHDLSIQGLPDALQKFGDYLSTITSGSLRFAAGLAGSILWFLFDALIVLLFAFFIEIDRRKSFLWVRRFFPRSYWPYIDDKASLIYDKIGQWARGQLMLCLSIGAITMTVLLILRMPYALTLGILSGFTEFIPYVGPLIGAVPAILIATAHGGLLWGLVILGVYYVIQVCENNFIVPFIMKRAVNLSAVTIMFSMMVGVSFPQVIHPVLGILLSVPIASIASIFLDDLRQRRQTQVHAEGHRA
jgi:predicted PurR-regulated permease PerM